MSQPALLVEDEAISDTTRRFISSEWIGCGKSYPDDDTPEFILAARREALALPARCTPLLPDSRLSVLELLTLKLPPKPSVLVTQEAQRAFSFDDPTDDLAMLLKRPIPSDDFIRKLQKVFGPAWFSGARSIVDARYKYSRLPLAALTYWTEMSIILKKRAAWKQAESWLTRWEREVGFLDEADHARILMGSLSWTARIQALGSDTGAENLAILLSEEWLDDEVINMLVQEIYARARLNPKLSREVAVLPLALQQVVRNAAMRHDYTHPLLDRCKRLIANGRQRIYFPVNVGGVHWVPCMVDVEAKVIRYGKWMSRSYSSTLTNRR